MPLDWNAGKVFGTLIHKVGQREGIGDILAEGVPNAARIIGSGAEQYALHMKGMHWPAHSAPPFTLAFCLATRGGNLKGLPHLLIQDKNAKVTRMLFGGTAKTRNIYSHEEKGRAVWWHENYKIMLDGLGSCFWLSATLLPHGSLFADELARAYTAVTGLKTDGVQMMYAAERVHQIQRACNALRGMTRKNDCFTKRPEPDSWGHGIDLNAKGMLDEYYVYRGLSSDGLLTRQRLEEINLKPVADTLEKHFLLKEATSCLPMAKIVENPPGQNISRNFFSKIIHKIEKRIIKKMEDPLYYRRAFEKKFSANSQSCFKTVNRV